jgi:hypothetical protein
MSAPGSSWLRRAGTGRLADGSLVTWSVAEGGKGRRWRWTVLDPDSGLDHVALLELDREGRFARLELETTAGMLTLHPGADRMSAHGNVVRLDGVEPIAIDWSDGMTVAIEGDPFGSAVAGWRGRGWVVGPDLVLRREDERQIPTPELDGRGVPPLLDAREWPLET